MHDKMSSPRKEGGAVAGRTFVLVHGSWHGGWCWRRVANRLQARGFRVYTPTLTGLAERSHLLTPEVTLDTHVADLVNLFRWEELSGVTLVGHSFGGWTVTGAVEKVVSRVSSIVYLDAFLPEDGQRPLDLLQPAQRQEWTEAWARGEAGRSPPAAASFALTEPADVLWVDKQMTPNPLGAYMTRLQLTGARERVARKAYVRAAKFANPRFDEHFNKLRADPAWTAVTMDCGHEVMLDKPDELTEFLIEHG